MEDIAILTIDMQEKFLDKHLIDNSRKLIDSHLLLYQKSIENKIPLIYAEYLNYGKTNSSLRYYLNKKETISKKILKKESNVFCNPELREFLLIHKLQNLILTGVNGPDCVWTTALSAIPGLKK